MASKLKISVQERARTRQLIRGKVQNYFSGIPFQGIGKFGKIKGHQIFQSNADSKLFNRFAGKTHEQLLQAWNNGRPRLTTCNGLAGLMFNQIFASKKKGINGLDFDLRSPCMSRAPLAWVEQSENPKARPGYGDIISYRPIHASICLGSQQTTWDVIQSGQGGKKVGVDIIAKGREAYPIQRIIGWINVTILWDYEELEAEHRRTVKAWTDSPWDALMSRNKNRIRSKS